MTGRPGDFMVGYDWREVLPGQAVPRGLEILASLGSHGPALARIPPKWRLEVEVREKGALARLEPPPPAVRFRMDVGRATAVWGVCEALRSAHPALFEPGVNLVLEAAGEAWSSGGSSAAATGAATVERARFFGNSVSCEAHRASRREPPAASRSGGSGTASAAAGPTGLNPKSRLDGLKFINFD